MLPSNAGVETQFKPGQSGNPNGRPRGSLNLRTLIKKVLDDEITDDQGNKTTRGLLIVKAMVEKAEKGDVAAFKALAERMEGSPNQKIEVERPVTIMPSVILASGKELEFDVGEPPPQRPLEQ